MFRVKLSIALAILLTIVLALAAVLYWGTQRAEYYYERSRLAHDALESYIQLSHDAYRHFKEVVDIIVLHGDANPDDVKLSYRVMKKSMDNLKNSTLAEIDLVKGSDEQAEEEEELLRIAELEKLLLEGVWAFNRVISFNKEGADDSAQYTLSNVLKDTIDKQFRPLIDTAINEERAEVKEANQRVDQLMSELKLIAAMTAVLATCFALAIGIALLRSINSPLSILVTGARKVAKGDLTHRISIPGRNEFTYLAKNFNDMTIELARQRQQLLTAQSDLEHKVDARTSELKEANDTLLRIDAERRRFFADISHELRTPLTAIRGEAEVTVRGKDKNTEEYRTALQRIVDLSVQLGQLIDDLLLLARSGSTSLRFELKPLKLDELLRDSCDDIQSLARNKQLELDVDIPEQTITINGDAIRLRQMLLILIDNACRYSTPGNDIQVALTHEQGLAIINVSDHGIGIPAEELGLIFERFSRGESARKMSPSGSGLGLPLAKTIVEAHHGQIKLASTPNDGTTLTVTLPILTTTDTNHGHTYY